MKGGKLLGIAVLALVAASVALFWLRQTPESGREPSVSGVQAPPQEPQHAAPPAAPKGAPSGVEIAESVEEQEIPPENASAPQAEVAMAPSANKPLSAVPHRVLKAWGGDESATPGVRGMTIIVDPSITNAELDTLARDVLARHDDAEILSTRIFDNEAAADYDLDEDGGALYNQHLVGQVIVDARRGKKRYKVRGEWTELTDEEAGAPEGQDVETAPGP